MHLQHSVMCYIQLVKRKYASLLLILHLILPYATVASSKVMDFGPKLPEFVQEHPNKSWLIKFYAPWCYHCQQLEPTFMNVAEKIYNKYDNLVVGRVDCTKNPQICEKYQVQAYPTIAYLNQDKHIPYRGDRSAESLIEFAERLNGPDLKPVDTCLQLKAIAEQRRLVIVGVGQDFTDDLLKEFKSLASELKSAFWFYHLKEKCESFINNDGVYIVKKHLPKPIKFQAQTSTSPKDEMVDWIKKESFPVFTRISRMNFESALATNKLIALAIVEEYKPARKISQLSKNFIAQFEKTVEKNVQHSDEILYAWSADNDLIQSIAIGHVPVPNVMLLKPDYTYHILVKDSEDLTTTGDKVPDKLNSINIDTLLQSALTGKLIYKGGNSFLYFILRQIYTQSNHYINMYSSNPLLASILIGFPSLILIFVIYTTCCYRESDRNDNDDEDHSDEEQLVNHVKQD